MKVTMFGGYLIFYTKKSKTLNINIKTDYWAHPKTDSITQQTTRMLISLSVSNVTNMEMEPLLMALVES